MIMDLSDKSTAGNKTKDVALVLSSGGPRGFAYIGAIEELERRGYNITSIAGTSIGSLIGGVYAAGGLDAIKDWLFSLDTWKVFTLMDFSLSANHIVKGDKVIEAMKEIVPDVNIEDLRIPYTAIASDLFTGEEVIFDKGDLFKAIRASISIPSLFRPVKYGNRTLIDGGIVNTMPLDRVVRNGHDILVGFDVNDIDREGIKNALEEEERIDRAIESENKAISLETNAVMEAIRHNDSITFREKLHLAGKQGYKLLEHTFKKKEKSEIDLEIGENYYSILSRTFSLMNHVNARVAIERFKPDILASMPFDAYSLISDYAKAEEISEAGRLLMKEAIDKYENISRLRSNIRKNTTDD